MKFVYFLTIAAVAFSIPSTGIAKPKVKVATEYYEIEGTTRDALRTQMKEKGPNGYFGWTSWYVRWTGSCQVSVEVNYIMPKLKSSDEISDKLKESFDTFYAALLAHEERHGSHGISAAEEIEASRCKDGNAIIEKWVAEDVKFDKETFHGQTEGVILR